MVRSRYGMALMNAAAYRQAIDIAITIATEPFSDGATPSFDTQMCRFVGALSGAIGADDPALAKRIKLVGQRAIAARHAVGTGAAA
jgi:hypothetical protein